MIKKTILVVANDISLTNGVLDKLRKIGCRVVLALNGEFALLQIKKITPDIVVLDDFLPDVDPLKLCWQIQEEMDSPQPIFFMASHQRRERIVGSLRHPPEPNSGVALLIDRIARFVERLTREGPSPNQVDCHGLQLNREQQRSTISGRGIELTPTEFKLLWELVSQSGYVLSRHELTEICIGASAAVKDRTVDAHIKSIRSKLKDKAVLIETIRGVGYRFLSPDTNNSKSGRRSRPNKPK